MSKVVVVAGVQSRQHYMTVNNRLRQSVGASRLMELAIGDLKRFGGLELYTGGGNAAIVYDDEDEARKCVRKWSREWLERAPDIRLVAGMATVDKCLRDAWVIARRQRLPEYEEGGAYGCELGYLPLTLNCPDTGRAAQVYNRDRRRWLSAEASIKDDTGRSFNDDLNNGRVEPGSLEEKLYLRVLQRDQFQFALDLEHLGLQLGARHIAIVHCDGNDMRTLFGELDDESGPQYPVYEDDELFAGRVREISEGARDASQEALLQTFEGIGGRTQGWIDADKLERIEQPGTGIPFFPARLLVTSGDDANWICAARLGLGSAVEYCRNFERTSLRYGGMRRTACAGVVIVPAGFPYRRAYELASELCASAKAARKNVAEWLPYSFIDFHVITEGSSSDLKEIRRLAYRGHVIPSRKLEPEVPHLHNRPLRIDPAVPPGAPPGSHETWSAFHAHWQYFQKYWGRARSRVKRLLEETAASYDRGKECADLFLSQDYKLPPDCRKPEECFDALELYDFYLPWDTLVVNNEEEDAHAAAAR
jgi:hypothetical protein